MSKEQPPQEEQRPPILAPKFEQISEELKARDQWVVWEAVWLPDKGKYSKVPYNALTGSNAKSTDSSTWCSFTEAKRAYEQGNGRFAGVGFVLSEADEFAGVDLDDAIGEDKKPRPEFCEFLSLLDSYTEVSPSGKGLRIFVRAHLPPGGRKKGHIEMYESARFLTVTGRRLPGTERRIMSRQAEVERMHAQVFPPPAPSPKMDRETVGAGVSGSDAELLEIAFKAENGAKIQALYNGDTGDYGGDHSAADLALASHLAFYTGHDAARLDNLFRSSGLMRPKWDEAHYSSGATYGEATIAKALASLTEVYRPPMTAKEKQAARERDLLAQAEAVAGGGAAAAPPSSRAGKGAGGEKKTSRPSSAPGSSDPPKVYLKTESGNAERFIDMFGDGLRYCHSQKLWFRWEKYRWVPDSWEHMEKAKAVVAALYVEAARASTDDERIALVKHAQASDKMARIKAFVEMAQYDPRIRLESKDWDKDPWLFNVENGTLDLRTGELQPHRREDLITKLAPVAYDADAACPVWEACMLRWQPDPEVRTFLQRAAGYSLTGDIGEETAFFLYGSGRNGKSKFTGALEGLLGDYAARVSIEVLMDSRKAGQATPELIPLIGARLVIASEIQENRRLNEAFVKDATGGDKLTARAMYAGIVEFRPRFKLWLYGNHKPQIRGTDDGIWSRLPMVPFTVTIPEGERDPDLAAKLTAERPGILAWAVRGCVEWQKRRLTPPDAVIAATAAYREQMDIAGGFFEDVCIFTPSAWTPAAQLRTAYEAWAGEQGEKRLLNPNQFADRLTALGAYVHKGRDGGKVVRGWKGVGLRSEFEDPEDFSLKSPNPPSTASTPTTEGAPEHESAPEAAREGTESGESVDAVDAVDPPSSKLLYTAHTHARDELCNQASTPSTASTRQHPDADAGIGASVSMDTPAKADSIEEERIGVKEEGAAAATDSVAWSQTPLGGKLWWQAQVVGVTGLGETQEEALSDLEHVVRQEPGHDAYTIQLVRKAAESERGLLEMEDPFADE